MKKYFLLFLFFIFMLVPISIIADNNSAAKVYLFYAGDPHSDAAINYFDSIKNDYNFELIKYEIWRNQDNEIITNEENEKLMEDIARELGKEAGATPFIIIGEKTFLGYSEESNDEIILAIKTEGSNNNKNDFVSKYLESKNTSEEIIDNSGEKDNSQLLIILLVCSGLIIVVMFVLLLKKNKRLKKKKNDNEVINDNKKSKKHFTINIYVIISIIAILFIIIGYITIQLLFKPNIDQIKDSVVMIEVYDENDELVATGSGFCSIKDNYIVTNYHVIEGASKIKIITDDKKSYDAVSVVIFDYVNDLAILHANISLKQIKLGSSSELKTGNPIIAIGSPLGELNTVSTGIISNAENDKGIQISAPISHGSSGGVLLDKNYKAIGITYAGIEEGQNLNYAIDIKYLKDMIYALNKTDFITIIETDSISFYDARKDKKTFVDRCYKQNNIEDGTDKLEFIGCQGNDEKYYATGTIKQLYDVTSKYKIYDNLMVKEFDRTYGTDYIGLSEERKKMAADLYEKIEFNSDIVETKISNMQPYEIIHSITDKKYEVLDGTNKYQIANTLADIYEVDNKKSCFNKVNSKFLEREEKIMFDLIYCNMSLNDLAKSDREYLIDYIVSLGMSQSKNEEIFKYFGYRVKNGYVYY